MKLVPLTVALLGATSAVSLDNSATHRISTYEEDMAHNKDMMPNEEEEDSHLSQLVTQALAGAPPGEITEPTADPAKDKENDTQMTKGKTINYEYFWKYACAFTKWTPTNQFLHAKRVYDAKTMTLERFGFIGTDKRCYWGMVGVKWLTPLKVN